MKIGIDIRCLMEDKKSGVEEYTLNLLENILSVDKENKYVLFLNSLQDPKFDFSRFEKYENVSLRRFRIPNKILNLCFWYFNYPKIDKMIGGVDILFFPNISFVAWSGSVKVIATAHDLSYERYPETFSWKRRLWHFFVNPKKMYQRVDMIAAVSQSTGDDLMNLFNISASKIAVIQSAIPDYFRVIDRNDAKLLEIKSKYGLPYKFILYLGTIEPRKNILSIIAAFDKMKEFNNLETQKYKLVIAGSIGWKYGEILRAIKKSKFSSDINVTGFINNDDRVYLYNLATLFVYPSLFEGFGFPVLEAMKCGVPVITSNNSSLPEISENAAILINPDRPDEILRAMQMVLSEKNLSLKLIESGKRQASKYDWKNVASEYLKLFKKDVQTRKNR